MRIDTYGSGPSVVCLHGAPSHPDEFCVIADAANVTAVVPVLPGYLGEAPSRATLADQEAALVALLAERGVVEAPVLGFSGGAFRALRLALNPGFRTTGMLLLGAVADMLPEQKEAYGQTIGALRAGVDLRPMVAGMMLSAAGQANAGHVAAVQRWVDVVAPSVLADELEAVVNAPAVTPKLGAVDIPVVLRTGAEDALVGVNLDPIAAAFPNATATRVPGAGHTLTIEDVSGTATALQALLARLP